MSLFPLCAKKNIGIMLGGTYNSGILASNLSVGAKFNYADAPSEVLERARGLQTVAARHRVSLKAAASAVCAGASAGHLHHSGYPCA